MFYFISVQLINNWLKALEITPHTHRQTDRQTNTRTCFKSCSLTKNEMSCKRDCAQQNVPARIYSSCACVHAQIFSGQKLVITTYLMSLSFKFHKDLSFRWGDISLFVTVYDLELKYYHFQTPQKTQFWAVKNAP